MFDDPTSSRPNVIGVVRIIRKKQIAAKLRKRIPLSKKDIATLSRKQARQNRVVTAGDLSSKRKVFGHAGSAATAFA